MGSFFAGDLHEKGLRGRLLEEVKNWAGRAGRKVLLRERLPRSEYLRCMATSRLALSPREWAGIAGVITRPRWQVPSH